MKRIKNSFEQKCPCAFQNWCGLYVLGSIKRFCFEWTMSQCCLYWNNNLCLVISWVKVSWKSRPCTCLKVSPYFWGEFVIFPQNITRGITKWVCASFAGSASQAPRGTKHAAYSGSDVMITLSQSTVLHTQRDGQAPFLSRAWSTHPREPAAELQRCLRQITPLMGLWVTE